MDGLYRIEYLTTEIGYLYVLEDTSYRQIIYVGISRKPKERFKQHRGTTLTGHKWKDQIEMKIIRVCALEVLGKVEYAEIVKHRKRGCPLLNGFTIAEHADQEYMKDATNRLKAYKGIAFNKREKIDFESMDELTREERIAKYVDILLSENNEPKKPLYEPKDSSRLLRRR